jgi:hypothetical protein
MAGDLKQHAARARTCTPAASTTCLRQENTVCGAEALMCFCTLTESSLSSFQPHWSPRVSRMLETSVGVSLWSRGVLFSTSIMTHACSCVQPSFRYGSIK